MKRLIKKIIVLAISAIMLFSCTACGGNSSDSNELMFWVFGGNEETAMYSAMATEFNATYGKEHGIHVTVSIKPPASYTTAVETSTTSSKSCPDVFLVVDDQFRTWIGKKVIANMEEYFNKVTDIDVSDIYSTSVNRLRFKTDTMKLDMNGGDRYGLPISSRPLGLYYNETMFKNAGIVIISVDEEDLDAFNAGTKADRNGKTLAQYKSEYPILNNLTGNIPAKGFFRSRFPYTGKTAWRIPDNNEVLIFNNRIPMNWDEQEDIAMLFTPEYNENAKNYFKLGGSPTLKKGFFTEWWFSYVWSVGGNCLQDLTGNGDFDYSLLDATDNYMVMKNGFVGAYTGKTYSVGETVEFMDKFDVPSGQVMVADNKGGYIYNGSPVGTATNIDAKVSDGTLYVIPSTLDAFTRYLRFGAKKTALIEGVGGLDISPKPLELVSKKAENFFFSGNIAMLYDYSSYLSVMSEQAKSANFSYDIAPIPVYKEYTDPTDPYVDSYNVKGKPAGQSSCYSMVSCPKSTKKETAAKFIMWMASENGQRVAASKGFFTNQESLKNEIQFPGIDAKYVPKNIEIFYEGLKYQMPGDWMYMPDTSWVELWSVPLNTYVRNGKNLSNKEIDTGAGYTEWKEKYIKETNEWLKDNYTKR